MCWTMKKGKTFATPCHVALWCSARFWELSKNPSSGGSDGNDSANVIYWIKEIIEENASAISIEAHR